MVSYSELLVGEDFRVRLEGDPRAARLRDAAALDAGHRHAARVLLEIDAAVAADLGGEPFAQGVDAGHADAVQPAGDLVRVVVELAAGVEHRHDDLERRLAGGLVDVHGDAAAVVGDGAAPVGAERDLDVLAAAGERLVNGVGHDLLDEVVQPARAGVADVHGGPLADGLDVAEDADLSGVVAVRGAASAACGLLRNSGGAGCASGASSGFCGSVIAFLCRYQRERNSGDRRPPDLALQVRRAARPGGTGSRS